MTETEIKDNFLSCMGNELGTSFFAMYKELVWTSKKWEEYQDLFTTNSERIKIVNQSAPLFFSIIKDSLENDILLSISRLTDPPTTGKFKNASIRRALPEISDEATRENLTTQIDSLETTVKTIREKRNKNISHIDFDNLFQNQSDSIIVIKYTEIEDALKQIQKIFNQLEQLSCKSSTIFERFPSMRGSYELLRLLDQGLQFDEAVQLQRGKSSINITPSNKEI
jgi:chlorite dismutase